MNHSAHIIRPIILCAAPSGVVEAMDSVLFNLCELQKQMHNTYKESDHKLALTNIPLNEVDPRT